MVCVAGVALQCQAQVVRQPAGHPQHGVGCTVDVVFVVLALFAGKVPAVRAAGVDLLLEVVQGRHGVQVPGSVGAHRQAQAGPRQHPFSPGIAPETGLVAQVEFRRDALFLVPTAGQQIEPPGCTHGPTAASEEGVLVQVAVEDPAVLGANHLEPILRTQFHHNPLGERKTVTITMDNLVFISRRFSQEEYPAFALGVGGMDWSDLKKPHSDE